MKKFSLIISLIVALAMLVMPVGAMAEPTTAFVMQVANPSVYMNGEEVFTLDGLAAQLAVLEDTEVTQLILDLFIGGENANSAMLQFDGDTNIVGYIGGMSSAYGINATEAIGILAAALEAEGGASFDQINEIIALAETWTLPEELLNVFNAHQNDFTTTDLGVMTGDAGVPMQYIQITGDMMPLVTDIAALIDNDALICAVLNLIDPTVDTLGLSAILAEANLGADMDITVGYDETETIYEIKYNYTISENGEALEIMEYYILADASDPSNIKITYNVKVTDDTDYTYMTQDGAMVITETGLTADVTEVMYGEVYTFNFVVDINGINDVVSLTGVMDEDNTVAFVYNGGATQEGYAFNLKCDVTEYGYSEGFELGGDWGMNDTAAHLNLFLAAYDSSSVNRMDVKLSADNAAGVYSAYMEINETYDGYTEAPVSVGISLTNIEPASGAFYSGMLSATINDGYDEISANAYIHLMEVETDTANFYIDPATAINLLTMDDAQIETASIEIENAFIDIAEKFTATYSEIFGY